MREYATPTTYEVPDDGNLTDDVVAQRPGAPATGSCSAASAATTAGRTSPLASSWPRSRAVAKGLIAAGIEPGDRVALISRTRYEWTLLDYAIWFAGAVTVPVYETSSADQVDWILRDSGARAPWSPRRPTTCRRVAEVRAGLPELQHVWSIEGNAVDVLSRLGADISDDELERRRTTRRPRGPGHPDLHLRHDRAPEGLHAHPRQLHVRAGGRRRRARRALRTDDASTLLFLPLAHVFARIIQVGCVKRARAARSQRRHPEPAPRPPGVPADASSWPSPGSSRRSSTPPRSGRRPTDAAGSSTAPPTSPSPGRAASTAEAPSLGGPRPARGLRPAGLRASCATRSAARCQYAISGGAPLGERLGHFYRGIGLTVLEGYGLTETTAALTANRPDAIKVGTVGRPLAGTAVRVADDGELLFRGGQVFAGYWRNDAGHRRGARRGRLVPHRRHRRGRRRGLRADHRPQEGDHRDRRRQERRPRGARGPDPGPRAGRPSAWSSVTGARSSLPWSPSTADVVRRLGREPRQVRRRRRPGRRPRPARRDRDGRRRRQQGGLQGRVDPQVHHPPGGLDRGERPADTEPEAQAQRRDAGVQGRRGRALPALSARGDGPAGARRTDPFAPARSSGSAAPLRVLPFSGQGSD